MPFPTFRATRGQAPFLAGRRSLAALLAAGSALAAAAAADDPAQDGLAPGPFDKPPYRCVLHVHTAVSGGRYSLEELTGLAQERGIDAVFLSDSLTAGIQYGVFPLRHILWWRKSAGSIMRLGPKRYIEGIRRENERQRDVLHIPGAEVCPRFYWTGSLSGGDLVCHDHQKNLVVLGVPSPEAFFRLPETAGYVFRKHAAWVVLSRLSLGCALVFPAVAVAATALRLMGLRPHAARPGRPVRWALFSLAAVVAFNGLASRHPALQIYGQCSNAEREQAAVDELNRQGLAHYWAHPSAADRHEFRFARVGFSLRTDPYPDVLLGTVNYTGFGGVYEAPEALLEPGSAWDRVLADYVQGRRPAPAWCFGESLYHYEGQAGKSLGNVETLVWADSRTEEALLRAMRQGRFYSRRNHRARSLGIDEWRVGPARSGETLHTDDTVLPVMLRVCSTPTGEAVTVVIVRDGRVLREVRGHTPLEASLSDRPADRPEGSCYRAIVRGKYPLEAVTNPIVVRRLAVGAGIGAAQAVVGHHDAVAERVAADTP